MSDTTPRGQLPYGIAPLAFRLPNSAHVGGVHLQVVDLQRSLSYYHQVLGLRTHRTRLRRLPFSARKATIGPW